VLVYLVVSQASIKIVLTRTRGGSRIWCKGAWGSGLVPSDTFEIKDGKMIHSDAI